MDMVGKKWLAALLLALSLVFAAGAAQAQAYKCRLPDGKVEISAEPCRNGKTEAVQPAETITPEQRAEAEQRAEKAKQYVAGREAAAREEEAARQARRAAAAAAAPPLTPAPPPQPVQEVYIVGQDPYSRCLRDVEALNLPHRQRLAMLDNCRGGRAVPQPLPVAPLRPHRPPDDARQGRMAAPPAAPQGNALARPCSGPAQKDGGCR